MVSNVVTCGAMPVNVAGEKYATTEMRTAQRGNKRVTRESMERRSWLMDKGVAQSIGVQRAHGAGQITIKRRVFQAWLTVRSINSGQ
jgi:hypothetical protein